MADKLTIVIGAKNLTKRAFRNIASGLQNLNRRASSVFSNIGRNAKRAMVAMTAAFVALGASSVKLASEALEIESKFDAVFEGIEKAANDAAKRISKDFDMIGTTTRKLLGDTGDLLTGFGFTKQSALELSEQTVRLAGDLASFTNVEGGAEAATRALASAMLGETERAKALGVVVRQDSKEFKDLVKESMKSQGATLLQAKAMAALTIATRQSKNAIGDYAKTQGFLANIMRKTQNLFKGFRIEIGKQLIDGLQLTNMFDDLANSIKEWTTRLRETGAVQRWAANAKEQIDEVATAFKQLFSEDEALRIQGFDKLASIGKDMANKFYEFIKPKAIELGKMIGNGVSAGIKSEAGQAYMSSDFTIGGRAIGKGAAEIRKAGIVSGTLQAGRMIAPGSGFQNLQKLDELIQAVRDVPAGNAEALTAKDNN